MRDRGGAKESFHATNSNDDSKYGKKSMHRRTYKLIAVILVFVLFVSVFMTSVGTNIRGGHLEVPIASSSNSLDNTVRDSNSESLAAKVHALDESGYPHGWGRLPRIPNGPRTGDDGKLHIIFSSGCNNFQHWQSEFLLASAVLAGQRGRITRIVSGCHDKSAEKVAHRHQTFPEGKNDLLVPFDLLNRSVNEDFGLFITPSFEGAKDFPWINKPSSIKYFMDNAMTELDRLGETTVAILDPDFIFIKPLTQTGSSLDQVIASRGQDTDSGINKEFIDVAIKGRPVGQRYGLESGWMVEELQPVEKITGNPDSPAKRWTSKMAAKYTSVGPPMILEKTDLLQLSHEWEKNMRPVLQAVGADILADMWAYSIGAADLDLKHTTLDHYMVSNWGTHGQAYEWIDAWKEMSCLEPKEPAGMKSPTFIHLASNFKAPNGHSGPWMFHKGHVPADILDCDSPLIVEAPDNLWEISVDRKVKQRAWVLCNTVSRLNKIVLMYKKKFCPIGFETRKLVRLIQSKTEDRECSQFKDKWCYPLAQIEGLPRDWRQYQ